MPDLSNQSLIAVDVGNSRISFGLFQQVAQAGLPQPIATLDTPTFNAATDSWREPLADWIAEHVRGDARWVLASVNQPMLDTLVDWLNQRSATEIIGPLNFQDMPLEVALENPAQVGIDRLLAAVATNRLRESTQAAIVVDLGSAITVDLVRADGAFAGGAILPGIAMASRALHEQTDQLPLETLERLSGNTPALGVSTRTAIQSGLYWGAVGAIRELISRLSENTQGAPDIFLTGGAAPSVATLFGNTARYEQHLVLSGIALAASDK